MRWTRRPRETSATGAYGEGVWSRSPDAGINPWAQSPGGRWQESPAHRGEHVISRKAIAQGMPVVSADLSLLACAKCIFFARKARGCGLHPAFPVPSYLPRDETDVSPGRKTCRGNVESHPSAVMPRQRVARTRAR
jgi:hypothetical protein